MATSTLNTENGSRSGQRVFFVAALIVALFGTAFLMLTAVNWNRSGQEFMFMMLVESAICFVVAGILYSLQYGHKRP